ncbi:MAG: hypothetical protein O7E54_09810 [Planctomycetota bacterium]|nr:hypothetical protein [Planctomycetota bacterium]
MEELVQAGSADEIRAHGRKVVTVGAVPVLVLWHEGSFRAIDNRYPHMGFFPATPTTGSWTATGADLHDRVAAPPR